MINSLFIVNLVFHHCGSIKKIYILVDPKLRRAPSTLTRGDGQLDYHILVNAFKNMPSAPSLVSTCSSTTVGFHEGQNHANIRSLHFGSGGIHPVAVGRLNFLHIQSADLWSRREA
jgi:hypothetical protein